MITLEQIAQHFEDGLNSIYNNKNIKFAISPNVGILRKSLREQNNITSFITGGLTVNSSSNDANLLVMGANGLTLEFAIPAKRPRTTQKQAAEELQKIRNGQYPFVNEVMNAINNYFENAQTFTLTDGDNEYSLAFHAGTSMTDGLQILPDIGECALAYASITLYFIEGGIISKDVQVTIDGARIPFQTLRVGRLRNFPATFIQASIFRNQSLLRPLFRSIYSSQPMQTWQPKKRLPSCLVARRTRRTL